MYHTEWDEAGAITLTDGQYEGEPTGEGGASRLTVTLVEPIAFDDLDGDGVDDAAVILVADAGGSGSFVSLEAVRNAGGEPRHVASYPLGDRTPVESLTISDGQMVLQMTVHGPDDPMCCLSQKATRTLRLDNGQLVLVSEEITAAQ